MVLEKFRSDVFLDLVVQSRISLYSPWISLYNLWISLYNPTLRETTSSKKMAAVVTTGMSPATASSCARRRLFAKNFRGASAVFSAPPNLDDLFPPVPSAPLVAGQRRLFHAAPVLHSASYNSAKSWIERQMKDKYRTRAQEDNYRTRAAYKMRQMDNKFAIFRKNQLVLDLGCFNGGWYAVTK